MTDIENHMVIGNEETDRDIMMDRIKDREDYERLKEATDRLLSDGYFYVFGHDVMRYDFEEALQRVYEYTSDPRDPELHDYADCAKEILELYPDSKLAKLIKHMAVVVAADALDIEI